MPVNSRAKGAAAEREVAGILRSHGFEARRGQQFSGGGDSPDVVSDFPLHLEVKRVENLQMHKAMAQSIADAPEGKPPCVVHRRSSSEWLLTMRFEDALKLIGVTNE